MAEINVERKKRSGWLWIIVLVVLAIIGYALYRYLNEDNNTAEYNGAPTSFVMPVAPHHLGSV
ncbi:hypothetical protein TH61_04575 [Rufibacter sp. DG15C]|uniref:hypothetical protein n=1 Tax=Rufibacter sp. DG15C TaxID=1379909 RepID=UPI00078CF051|nr:hypothetical protein [Rufibacter sp. DG15C]AMM50595.1 hypothetical protein TH61_04575 [Rufibacter sp. DG15C]